MLLEFFMGHADVGGLKGALPTTEALQLFIHGIELEEMHLHLILPETRNPLSGVKVLTLLVTGSKALNLTL